MRDRCGAGLQGNAIASAALDEIRDLRGGKTHDLLADFAADLRRRFASERVEDLAFDAHATISAAGMLGLVGLVDVCRDVEEACRAGADATLPLARLQEERRRVVYAIEGLHRAA